MNLETNWNYSRILLYRTGIIQTSTYIEVGLWSQLWATAKRPENHRIYRTRIYQIIGYIEQSASPQASTIVVYIECLLAVAAFSALTLLVGRQQGHPACKKLSGGVLEGTVRHCQSKEASIPWSHHEETKELPGERDNARNNARCT